MADFSDRIKELRKKHKETQKAVALAVEMSERNFQDLEYGRIKPSYDNIIKLADHFGVTTDYLLGRTNYWQDSEGHITVKVPPDIFSDEDKKRIIKGLSKPKK